MKISTPKFLQADFFMRNDAVKIPEINNNKTKTLPQIMPSQIHEKNIIIINDENFSEYALPERPKADGIFLMTRMAEASLRFADCAPVMIYAENYVMILHSGYKGTVLNISGAGVELIRHFYGDEVLKKSSAWIGPCIGRRNYSRNIDDEWTEKGLKSFHRENYDYDSDKNHVFFDIAGEIYTQLCESGINTKNIVPSGIDTFTDENCFSYRRGDITERMTLHVSLK